MFCKWLQESENLRRQMLLHNHLKLNKNMKNTQIFDLPQISQPNSSSDDEEFLETESDASVWTPPPQSFIPIVIDSSKLPMSIASFETNSSSSTTTLNSAKNQNLNSVSAANLLNVSNLSRNSSSSDVTINSSQCGSVISGNSITKPVKKLAQHSKGKAPPIPVTATTEKSEEKLGNDSETNVKNDEQKEINNEKDRKKKGILNYLPALFRPLSPTSSTQNINNNKNNVNTPHHENNIDEGRLETEI